MSHESKLASDKKENKTKYLHVALIRKNRNISQSYGNSKVWMSVRAVNLKHFVSHKTKPRPYQVSMFGGNTFLHLVQCKKLHASTEKLSAEESFPRCLVSLRSHCGRNLHRTLDSESVNIPRGEDGDNCLHFFSEPCGGLFACDGMHQTLEQQRFPRQFTSPRLKSLVSWKCLIVNSPEVMGWGEIDLDRSWVSGAGWRMYCTASLTIIADFKWTHHLLLWFYFLCVCLCV